MVLILRNINNICKKPLKVVRQFYNKVHTVLLSGAVHLRSF